MKTEKLLLSQVVINKDNPRHITDSKLNKLAERLLVFPKMIHIRPVVIDNKMVALGGNMRIKAMQLISTLTIEDIRSRVEKTKNYQRMTKAEQELLVKTWNEWLQQPTVEVVRADILTEDEKKEFIIADNASFGDWDYDKLSDDWDEIDLSDWGVDITWPKFESWNGGGDTSGQSLTTSNNTPIEPIPDEDILLPEELVGLDVTPDTLPKINGTDEVEMERIIIVYKNERKQELAEILGLESIDKVVYNLDEIANK